MAESYGVATLGAPARRPAPAAVVASASPSSSRDVALVIAGSGTGLEDHWLARRWEGVRWLSATAAGARVAVVPGTRAGVGGVQRTLSPRLESTEHGVVFESWRHPTP